MPSGGDTGLVDKPNIVWIMADDLGYGDLGCYGQETIRTPRLDRMAEEGVRFTSVYAGSTVCAPSRCSLMTGLHTGNCRVRGNKLIPLEPEDFTVAEALQGAGYATALVGKWGLGEPDTTGIPNRQGFDYFFGYLNQHVAHNYYPEFLWRNEERVRIEGNVVPRDNVATERAQYAHDLFTDEALTYIDDAGEAPFFLYVAYTLPHANNERGRALGDGMEVPDYGSYADEDWPDPQKGHAAMITRLDRDVGRILDRLRERGLAEETLVIFTSDNGTHREGGADPEFFESSGPLRGIKRDLYEGGIRVPTIAWWPGTIEAGRVEDTPWAFWDFMPTAMSLAGLDTPDGLDGIDVAPLLRDDGGAIPDRDYFYWEFFEGGFKQALRMGDWKAVRSRTRGPVELYNVVDDLGETIDRAEENAELVVRAKSLFGSARTASEDWPTPKVVGR